jgi:hypothetical protein
MYAQVDRYEENLAVLVFDDEQQLVLPRESLPAAARPGTAVRVDLYFTREPEYAILAQELPAAVSPEAPDQSAREARWAVPVRLELSAENGQTGGLAVTLADGQQLVLPAELAPGPGGELVPQAWLVFEVDPAETARRRAYVRALVQRLFGHGAALQAPQEGEGDV